MKRYNKIFFMVLGVALFTIVQCSSEKNYKTMSLFFDGVPDPAKPKTENKNVTHVINDSSANMAAKNKSPQPFVHPPYSNHQCEKCHEQGNMTHLIMEPPKLCYTCHEPFEKKYAFVHGPTAEGACTQCHNPHLSKNKNLLVRLDEKMCFNCHDSKMVMQDPGHAGISISECTTCHNPHGGKDRYLSN